MFLRGCLWCLLWVSTAHAQHGVGGRYLAMGNTGTALGGIHSLTANQAGLVEMDGGGVGIFYQNHFFDAAIHSQAVMLALPTRVGVFGAVANRYALAGAFSETKAGFAYSRLFGPRIAVAMAFHYHQLRIPSYGGSTAFSAEVGMQYRSASSLIVGVHYANPGKLGYGADVFSVVPSVIRAGASYRFADVVTVSGDIAYLLDDRLDGRMGLEYRLIPWLCFRGGLSTAPMQQYAGFGLAWEQLATDFSMVFHPRLGMSPQVAVVYAF